MARKHWSEEHVRLGVAAHRVSRKLLDLANAVMVLEAHPALPSIPGGSGRPTTPWVPAAAPR